MFLDRRLALAVAAALAVSAPALAQENAKDVLQLQPPQLVAIIESPDAPVFEKAKACQRLAVVGSADAVPALAALLADENLNLYARYGLEGIPDPAADEALRKAAEQLEGRQLVGVIDSLGQQRDEQSVELLAAHLGSEDQAVAVAAAIALGKIGNPPAAKALTSALGKDADSARSIAHGALIAADSLASAGAQKAALSVYSAIAKADVPKHIQVAALGGQLSLLASDGKELLVAQIRSPDEEFFNLGLAAARRMPGEAVTEALAAELEALPPQRQAGLLLALGDRQQPPPLEVVVQASNSPSADVRAAAIAVLARFGDASATAILLDAALGEGEVARSALDRLKNLPGEEVDTAIVDRFSQSDAKAKVVLLELIGARRIGSAEPAVQSALEDADPSVQSAALAALGQLVALDDLDQLITRALAPSGSPQVGAAQMALRTAALRMGDREGCADRLAESLQAASIENQVYLLDLLGDVSGDKALETVVANAASDEPAIKDAATRVLGEWVNADAAPALLDIAQNDSEPKYRVRALRGYLRIARQLQLSPAERLEMFNTAMQAAQRDEEKQLAMDVLTRIPSVDTLSLAVDHLDKPGLKDAAAEAAVRIARKLIASEPQVVADAMQKIVDAGAGGNAGAAAEQLLQQAKAALN